MARLVLHIARLFALLALFAAPTLTRSAPASDPGEVSNSEYAVKAAFLYKFLTYVKWPDGAFDSPKAPIIVAVVGPDPFGRTLDDALRNKQIGERKLQVVRFKTTAEIGRCHLLFVPAHESPQLSKIVAAVAGKSVLLVGETAKFASSGGCVNFVIVSKRVHFEINPDAAKRAGLEISSQLLKLARIVKDEDKR